MAVVSVTGGIPYIKSHTLQVLLVVAGNGWVTGGCSVPRGTWPFSCCPLPHSVGDSSQSSFLLAQARGSFSLAAYHTYCISDTLQHPSETEERNGRTLRVKTIRATMPRLLWVMAVVGCPFEVWFPWIAFEMPNFPHNFSALWLTWGNLMWSRLSGVLVWSRAV